MKIGGKCADKITIYEKKTQNGGENRIEVINLTKGETSHNKGICLFLEVSRTEQREEPFT